MSRIELDESTLTVIAIAAAFTGGEIRPTEDKEEE